MKTLVLQILLIGVLLSLPWLVYWYAICRVAMHDIQDKDGE